MGIDTPPPPPPDTPRYEGDAPRAEREKLDMREARPIEQKQPLDDARDEPEPVLPPGERGEAQQPHERASDELSKREQASFERSRGPMEAEDQLIEQESLFMNHSPITEVLPHGAGLAPHAIEAVRGMWQGREVIVDDLKHAAHGAVDQVASPTPDDGSV